MWLLAVFVWLATVVGVLGLCRAASEGDRAMHSTPGDDLERLYALPDRYCPTCSAWLPGEQLFCGDACQGAWLA